MQSSAIRRGCTNMIRKILRRAGADTDGGCGVAANEYLDAPRRSVRPRLICEPYAALSVGFNRAEYYLSR